MKKPTLVATLELKQLGTNWVYLIRGASGDEFGTNNLADALRTLRRLTCAERGRIKANQRGRDD